MFELDRRRFLLTTAAAMPLAQMPRAQVPAEPGQIVRMASPQNLETNFANLDGPITPNHLFYVRNHFAAPKIDRSTWRLRVEGAVDHPLELSLADVQKLGNSSRPMTMECAGNGRVFLVPAAKGVNWQLGAVGTAEWTGVALSSLLQKAGVRKGAVEVILEGADSGRLADPAPPAPIHFARSLALEKANKPEVLLAWGMNGKNLPAAHGGPLRAVVGGWYGMASVKWLTRITVTEKPFHGYFQSFDYSYYDHSHGLPTVRAVTAIPAKSQIARPTVGEVLAAGKPVKITGAAWAGEANVKKVDVSVDGGKTWNEATLQGDSKPFCWRLWEYEWKSPAAGKAVLMSRATDSNGKTQPMKRNSDYRSYMITHVLPVEIEVK